ncbi:MAG: VWA domain-containing protein, partial [Rhodobacteraceae bacterium]|nr:VWA domain-containing protein [Paracoccaceae bacterium]
MTDDLDRLKSALRAAAPAPDADAKARAMALAMENFDRLQGSADAARSSDSPPPKAGVIAGVLSMLKSLSSRPALAATTSAAALIAGIAVILPLTGQGPLHRADLPGAPAPVTGPEASSMAEAAPPE